MKYECAECHLAVIVLKKEDGENEIIKACGCDAPVLANAIATVIGLGGLSNGNH